MHDPIGLLAVGGAAGVENKGFPHPNSARVGHVDCLVSPRGLPESGGRCSVCSGPRRVLFVLVAEEVPFVLGARPDSTFLCHSPSIVRKES